MIEDLSRSREVSRFKVKGGAKAKARFGICQRGDFYEGRES